MKRYTFEVVVIEGSDEFWEELDENGKSGCDEVLEMVRDELYGRCLFDKENCSITLTKFEDS